MPKTPFRMLALGLAALVAIGVGVAATPPEAADAIGEPTFTNSLVTEADPTIEFYNGNYYYVATTWTNQVTMRKSPTLAGLKTAAAFTVYSDTNAGRNANMWAPELKRLNGPNGWRWYLMYTMGAAGNFDNQRLHVLESAGDDPAGPYTYKGRPVPTTTWNIDGSYLELNGELFMVWSMFAPDGLQSNYIARMSNPWTATSAGSLLSRPVLSWETQGGAVNEGPIAIQRNGRTFIVYSASGCWTPDYKLGMLTYTSGDPLLTSSWAKGANPVFQKTGTVFGPGHNDFFTSPDGTQTWNLFHANNSASDGCGTTRSSRAQQVTWDAAGAPVLGTPVSNGAAVAVPSGELSRPTVPVPAASYELVNRNSGLCASISGSGDGAGLVQSACANSAAAGTSWKLDPTADGYYRLVNAASSKPLDAANCGTGNGTAVRQWTWLANACQQWRPAVATAGYLTLANRNAGTVLGVVNCATTASAAVNLSASLGNACQQWSLRPVGAVAVVSAASGKSFDLPGCSTAAGAILQQWEWTGSPCQRYTFTSAANGYVQLHPTSSAAQCLGVTSSGTADGATVTQGACSATSSQWRIELLADGTLRFVAVHSGKSLDLAGCGLANGTRLNQWSTLDNQCQRFRIAA